MININAIINGFFQSVPKNIVRRLSTNLAVCLQDLRNDLLPRVSASKKIYLHSVKKVKTRLANFFWIFFVRYELLCGIHYEFCLSLICGNRFHFFHPTMLNDKFTVIVLLVLVKNVKKNLKGFSNKAVMSSSKLFFLFT